MSGGKVSLRNCLGLYMYMHIYMYIRRAELLYCAKGCVLAQILFAGLVALF